jgi:hypothetical protein
MILINSGGSMDLRNGYRDDFHKWEESEGHRVSNRVIFLMD